MDTIGVGHLAIGVSDMGRSLRFYRDTLGFQLTLDIVEKVGGTPAPGVNTVSAELRKALNDPQREQRRAAYLRWDDSPNASIIVLSEYGPASGEAIKLDQVGIHHVSFWVKDLRTVYERLKAEGVPILQPLKIADTVGLGEKPGGQILTTMVRDPDQIIVQLDERLTPYAGYLFYLIRAVEGR